MQNDKKSSMNDIKDDLFSQPGEAGQQLSLIDIVKMGLIKRLWIPVSTVLAVAIVSGIVLMKMKQVHLAQSLIMVETYQDPLTSLGLTGAPSIGGAMGGRRRSVRYFTSILFSGYVWNGVVKQYCAATNEEPTDSLIASLKGMLGLDIDPKNPEFLQIKTYHLRPDRSLLLNQIVVDVFRDATAEYEREEQQIIAEFIQKQLDEISEKMEKNERNLSNFMVTHNFASGDSANSGPLGQISKIQGEIYSVNLDLEFARTLQQVYQDRIEEKLQSGSQANSQVRTELLRLTKKHRELGQKLEAAQKYGDAQQVELLEVELDSTWNQFLHVSKGTTFSSGLDNTEESSFGLKELIDAQQKNNITINNLQVRLDFLKHQLYMMKENNPEITEQVLEFVRLQRYSQIYRQAYFYLFERLEEIKVSIAGELGGVKVLDEARYAVPVPRRRTQRFIFFILLAIIVSVGFVTVLEWNDQTVKSEDEVVNLLGQNILGSVPIISEKEVLRYIKEGETPPTPNTKSHSRRPIPVLIHQLKHNSPLAEVYRQIKINLQFLTHGREKRMFVVTSSLASEGKSVTSLNLAMSFAETRDKSRCLLIDGDVRKSSIHRYLNLNRIPGLTNVLLGQATIEDVLHKDVIPNLDIITGGSTLPNPAEFFSSEKASEVLAWAKKNYNLVIIDSPPSLSIVDARILAQHSDGVILVIKRDYIDRRIAAKTIEAIKRGNSRVLGVILNQVSLRHRFGYYGYLYYRNPYKYYNYAYQGYYGYTYYADDDEKDGKTPGIKKRKS